MKRLLQMRQSSAGSGLKEGCKTRLATRWGRSLSADRRRPGAPPQEYQRRGPASLREAQPRSSGLRRRVDVRIAAFHDQVGAVQRRETELAIELVRVARAE